MKKISLIGLFCLIFVSFFLQLLGIMHVIPLYVSSPILFLSFLVFIYGLRYKKRFKGF